MIEVGSPAPDFDGATQDGKRLRLSSLRGHPVVLYFYPKADTSGCTLESKGLRDAYPSLKGRGVEVVGVSTDDVDAQKDFCEKYQLPFPLVADSKGEVVDRYGVRSKSGRARRVSFFLDAEGRVREVVDTPEAGAHVEAARRHFLSS
jgi:peroxiredoxin Q/BCP